MAEEENCIDLAATPRVQIVLPTKSRDRYDTEYKKFEKWCASMKVQDITEKVLLAYFTLKSEKDKPSTLWTHYSMLRSTISIKKNIDISKYIQLVTFLKRKGEGYTPVKSNVFSKENIETFLTQASDDKYLMMKVSLIVGISGACRREELTKLKVGDISDEKQFIKINMTNIGGKGTREFVISKGNIVGFDCIDIFRKYANLRPPSTSHDRFFVYYMNGKCNSQPIGINTFGRIPKEIAIFLGLANPELYTGHCFRKSPASLLTGPS